MIRPGPTYLWAHASLRSSCQTDPGPIARRKALLGASNTRMETGTMAARLQAPSSEHQPKGKGDAPDKEASIFSGDSVTAAAGVGSPTARVDRTRSSVPSPPGRYRCPPTLNSPPGICDRPFKMPRTPARGGRSPETTAAALIAPAPVGEQSTSPPPRHARAGWRT